MKAELFHVDRRTGGRTDGRTDGQTDMRKVTVTFPNYANASKTITIVLL